MDRRVQAGITLRVCDTRVGDTMPRVMLLCKADALAQQLGSQAASRAPSSIHAFCPSLSLRCAMCWDCC
jgi:hypothetical protein